MQILFVTPFYAPEWKFGGPPKKISGMARALGERGHAVRVITFDSKRRAADDLEEVDTVSVQYLPWVGRGLRQIPRRRDLLSSAIAEVDIIHCFGLYNFICPVAARMASHCGKPFVIEPMGMFTPRNRSLWLKRLFNRTITRSLFRRASGVIATSEIEAAELRKQVDPGALFIRPNGVTLSGSALADRNTGRHLLKVSENEKLIGYIGRISRMKQLKRLVSAFASATSPGTKLLIAGPVTEPDYCKELKQAIQSSSRRSDIAMEGLLEGDRYVSTLKALDLFVLPSESENFGNAAAEAVLAGVPVLLTRDCGVASAINGRVGLAVEQGVDALTTGMETMLAPETYRRWEPHWAQVQSELSWEKPVQIQEEIYQRILASETRKA